MAQTLLDAGWADVRPLLGGFDAWRAAGYPLQAKSDQLSRSGEAELSLSDMRENLQKAEGDEVH